MARADNRSITNQYRAPHQASLALVVCLGVGSWLIPPAPRYDDYSWEQSYSSKIPKVKPEKAHGLIRHMRFLGEPPQMAHHMWNTHGTHML